MKDWRMTLNEQLKQSCTDIEKRLAEPIAYTIETGGKRVRPALVMATARYYDLDETWFLPLAKNIEFFHNFSLLHDDIMDEAPIRRGQESSYARYGLNQTLLSGDAMLIHCYKILEAYASEETYSRLIQAFSDMAMKVCEGQQSDMDFESRQMVSEEEYFEMINGKTAALLSFCCSGVPLLAKASERDIVKWKEVGKNIGLAFQLKDDWLDYYADQSRLGKQQAGDVIQKKKSILYITAMQKLNEKEGYQLREIYHSSDPNRLEKVDDFFAQAGVKEIVRQKILKVEEQLISDLDYLEQRGDLQSLKTLLEQLTDRQY